MERCPQTEWIGSARIDRIPSVSANRELGIILDGEDKVRTCAAQDFGPAHDGFGSMLLKK